MSRQDWFVIAVYAVLAFAIAFFAPYAFASDKMSMLSSTVRIKTGDGTGSGVVFSSTDDVYIATANHVVAKSYETLEAPEKRGKITVYRDIEIQFFRYEGGRMKETIVRTGRVVAFDKGMDIAIVKVKRRSSPISDGTFATATIGINPEVFDEVFSVGAGLSQVPFPTQGIVASLDGVSTIPKKEDPVFIMHSAHVIWGFSGGGLWRFNRFSDKYELIGINVQVGIEATMAGMVVVTFMSYAVRMEDVVKLARKNHVPL